MKIAEKQKKWKDLPTIRRPIYNNLSKEVGFFP
jgi:hypothetical protein